MRKSLALCIGKSVGIYQVEEERMSIPGRRTCMYKGMKALGIFRYDRKLNIDGMWGCSGEGGEKRLQKLVHEGHGMSC